ncbi:uncharacterized protein LOC142227129 [Haematobia irritans]|uniref:uncharacterized protein LOC142227129 n=1 Tax=Haematobia irritans TaxID=7368 RepID=UPI003F50AC07
MASEQNQEAVEEITEAPSTVPEETITEEQIEGLSTHEMSPAEEELAALLAIEEDEEGEDYSKLGSSDDPERARNYKEYKRLEKEIRCQNTTIKEIKSNIAEIECKSCLTKCDENRLKELYKCMEQETKKLNCLAKKAMRLQNFGSHRHYKEIELVQPFIEKQMPPLTLICEQIQGPTSMGINSKSRKRAWRASGGDTTSDIEKSCSYGDEKEYCEQQKLMNEIMATLQSYTTACSGGDNKNRTKSHACEESTMCKLKQKMKSMQKTINKLNEEISQHERKGKSKRKSHSAHSACSTAPPTSCPSTKTRQFDELKDNYTYLLNEFTKKEAELKEITQRVKSNCGSGGSADSAEIKLLTSRVNDLKEEQIEFKCLMKEQSSQLDDYRKKYLTAQQKVEEQCAIIEKLNMCNKRIEKQINLEIKDIRCKFQEKLNELLQYPKLLENEQIKVAKLCKQKEDLENKLSIVCKELKNFKSSSGQNKRQAGDDSKSQLQKCQQDLEKTKKNFEEMQKQRDLFCEQLKQTQDDLNCLRSESAKIIARTNERNEIIKEKLQEHINCLEKQLAQCRATASLSVSDRECVIREMQGQLNTLSYSFDSAQKQIKTLRNHIAYMSNENCFQTKN